MLTQPAASTSLCLLMGYNLGMWVVRNSFHLEIPSGQLGERRISLISGSVREIVELMLVAVQFAGLVYLVSFPI